MLMKIMNPIVTNDANMSADAFVRLISGIRAIGPHLAVFAGSVFGVTAASLFIALRRSA